MNAMTQAETREIELSANAILGEKVNKLQAEVSSLKAQLAKYKAPAMSSAERLERFEYEHPELEATLECFMYAPRGCDPDEIELRYVFLRGVDITQLVTDAEADKICEVFAKQPVEVDF